MVTTMKNQQTDNGAIVHLPLGGRSYDIHIKDGILDTLENYLQSVVPPSSNLFVITETIVASLYEEKVQTALNRGGYNSSWFTVEPGENSKRFPIFEGLVNNLLEAGISRNDMIVALGGGVIGDLAGFAAASVLRGVNFIQVPTTLLSQVDSSVGGKTGINTPSGKNLLGAFHQPKSVLIDPNVLSTLPERELQAGYAEIIKYGLIDDPEFFEWLEENGAELLGIIPSNRQRMLQITAIQKSCEAKARVVAADERESGKRALLNLGHTFGHALEAECGYDSTLLHGEGVAIGMVMALDLSARMQLTSASERDRLVAHLKDVGMKWCAKQIGVPLEARKLLSHMAKDKKVEAGSIGFILGPIGKASMHRGVDLDLVEAVLHDSVMGVLA